MGARHNDDIDCPVSRDLSRNRCFSVGVRFTVTDSDSGSSDSGGGRRIITTA